MATVPKNTGLYKKNPVLRKKRLAVIVYLEYSNPTEAITRQANKGNNMAPLIEFDQLSDAGWITITELGEENIYFTFELNGMTMNGFCKAL